MRVAFIGYRDIADVDRFVIEPFTANVDRVKNTIASQKATGGGDECEDLIGAFQEALKLDFKAENLTNIFLICDAPCHGR